MDRVLTRVRDMEEYMENEEDIENKPLFKAVTPIISELKQRKNTEQDQENRKKISQILTHSRNLVKSTIRKNVPSIIRHLCDLLSFACNFIPVAGNILSCVLFVIHKSACAIGGSEGIGKEVKKEIELVLEQFNDSELRSMVAGTERVFNVSLAYLKASESELSLERYEVAALASNVPVYHGVEILGILRNKIENISRINDLEHGRRAIEYTNLYVTLAVLRSAVLTSMVHIVESAKNSPTVAKAIHHVLIAEENTDKEFLQFLTTPKYEMACLFSLLQPSKEPVLSGALAKYGLSFQKLGFEKDHVSTFTAGVLGPMKMCADVCGWMNALGLEKKFMISPVDEEKENVDNMFYIQPKRWPEWYVYMTCDLEHFCRARRGKPGPQGEWKFVKVQDNKYILSPIKWPDLFVYMRMIRVVRGQKNDPSLQGLWTIETYREEKYDPCIIA